MDPDLKQRLDDLQPGDYVVVTDSSGAKIAGTIVARRLDVDPADEVRIRRPGGTKTFVPYDRVTNLE